VVENVRVSIVVTERLFEALECLHNIALLHVNASELDPALRQGGVDSNGRFQILLCAGNIRGKEPVNAVRALEV
jgi:hypothetical protein